MSRAKHPPKLGFSPGGGATELLLASNPPHLFVEVWTTEEVRISNRVEPDLDAVQSAFAAIATDYRYSGGWFSLMERRVFGEPGRLARARPQRVLGDDAVARTNPFHAHLEAGRPDAPYRLYALARDGESILGVEDFARERAMLARASRSPATYVLGVNTIASSFWHCHM